MIKVIPHDAVLIPDNATCVFKGVLFDVFQWGQELFDGSSATFEALRRPDTVSVIAVIDDKLLLMEEEQPRKRAIATFPGGRVDSSDESILEAAKRELREETGYELTRWKLVDVCQPYSKIEWFVHTFVVWGDVEKGSHQRDPGERISISLKDFTVVKSMAINEVGYIGEDRKLFKSIDGIEDLVALPEYSGREVDR